MTMLKNIFHNLLNLFFPDTCIVCQERLHQTEQHICLNCLSLLPKTNYHLQPDNRLEQFFAGRIPFERIAAFAYFIKGGSIQKLIHELKYKQNPKVGYFLGQLCGNNIKDSDFINSVDLIIPVPLHPKRERQRGYNQALEICKGIATITEKPIDNSTLIRTVNNPSQTKSSRFERWENVEDIFQLSDNYKLEGKHILLVDDVITTGSTIEACVKALLATKDIKISILAIGAAG